MQPNWRFGQGARAIALVLAAPMLIAADHADGPAATAEPAADITDVFAWTSADAARLNLVLDVFASASTTSKFSDAVQYVFHTRSKASFASTQETAADVICTFDAAQVVSCWAGTSFVTGDASAAAGITSADGKLKVFAGLRNDPFFFNLSGFKAAAATVASASSSLVLDTNGCPALDAATSTALVTQLGSAPGGGAATDDFAGKNVLALVISLDKTLVNAGGPIVNLWASTRRSQ